MRPSSPGDAGATMKPRLAAAVLAAVASIASIATIASGASAAPGAGTLDDPVVVDAFPYAVRGTTVGAANAIDDYA